MTRDALFYTIQRNGDNFAVMRVTRKTEKRVYGSIDGISTHCAPGMIYGSFATEKEASYFLAPIIETFKRFEENLASLRLDIEYITKTREESIARLLRSIANAS